MESTNYWICILSICMCQIFKISFHWQKVKTSWLGKNIRVFSWTLKPFNILSIWIFSPFFKFDIENMYHLRFYQLYLIFFIEYHELMKMFSLSLKIGGGGVESESEKNIRLRFQKQFGPIVCRLSPSNYVETWLPGLS